MIASVRRERSEWVSFDQMKREAAASARALATLLEHSGTTIEAVRQAERRTSAVLAELRMVAASLAE